MINKSYQKISELKTLRIGYTSLGWPLKNFPSGIVAYIQNLLLGFESSINPIVFAGTLIGDEIEDRLVDLRNFNRNKSLFNKLLFNTLYLTKLPLVRSVLYHKMMQNEKIASRATTL